MTQGTRAHEAPGEIRRKRLGMVLPERFPVPPRRGFCTAIELWAYWTIPYLKNAYDLSVYSITHPTWKSGMHDGTRYVYLHPNKLDSRFYPWLYRVAHRVGGRRSYWDSVNYYRSYAKKVGRAVSENGVEVVHLHNILQFAPWIRRAAPDAKIVLDIKWHGLVERKRYYTYEVLCTDTAKRCLAAIDHIVTPSRYMADATVANFPDMEGRVTYVPNGVEPRVFQPSEAGPRSRRDGIIRIVHAGRFTPEKGAHHLLEAFAKVLETHQNVELRLMGEFWTPGEQLDGFQALVDRRCREMGGRAKLVGWRDAVEFSQELQEADIFVHPAEWDEPFSMVVLEAMSSANAIVATATGGTPEQIVDGEHGLLVPAADPPALARAMLTLIEDEDLRRRLGRNARARALREFTWEHVVDHLRPIYS